MTGPLPAGVSIAHGDRSGPRVVVIGMTHGNEPVGGRVLPLVAAALPQRLVAGSVVMVRANLDAEQLGLRHTPGGQDMNRLWDPTSLTHARCLAPDERSSEQHRVLELLEWLESADCIIDVHSTSRPSKPFLLFRDDRAHRRIAAQLGVPMLVTGVHEAALLPGGLAANVGLTPGIPGPRLGFVLEAGQHDEPGIESFAWDVVQRLLACLGLFEAGPPVSADRPEVYEVVERFAQPSDPGDAWTLVAPERVFRSKRSLVSFETVDAGEVLARAEDGSVMRADEPFTMLMPAAAAAPGEDLFFAAQRRYGGLGDDVAPAELPRVAAGIEAMLDLVDGDAFERGHTWACFDNGRTLDRCADLIGAVLRLPADHPDRRIAVVGPGQFEGDPGDVRRGRRYRQAMRRALEAGIPIDRYQLLRGTSLAWMDALTSAHSASRFVERRVEGPVRMFLSMRQPPAVSVLVCGDLKSAVALGSRRQVRVAVVVEAPTLAPAGDHVDVHLARAALFSGRAEVLGAVWRLLTALKDDHQEVVDRQEALGLSGVLSAGGMVRNEAVAADLIGIQELLRRLQVETWAHALIPLLHDESIIPEGEFGHWLAALMTETGIRDAYALQRLTARKTDAGWHVSPEYVGRALVDPLSVTGTTPHRDASPRQLPLLASEVDVDGVEHWVGWKRRMHSLPVIPGTRGRDLDLPLRGSAIHQTLTRLYGWARTLAARSPDDVMVVIAGDGQTPHRNPTGHDAEHLLAHRDLLRDPNVRYLRIQHAEATHMGWLKDWASHAAARGRDAAPVALHWEREVGDTVNVVLIATRRESSSTGGRGVLDGWRIEAAGLLISELEVAGGDYAVGLFTHQLDGITEHPNADMLQFARAHCQAAIGTAELSWTTDPAEIEECITGQLARWIREARRDGHLGPGRIAPGLAGSLQQAVESDLPAEQAAADAWSGLEAWPGTNWRHIAAAK